MPEVIYSAESYRIIGACFEVYKEEGCGFHEPVYQERLGIEFRLQSIPAIPKPRLELAYKGEKLEQRFEPDYICFGKIVVELKAVAQLTDDHRAQVMNYLKATGFKLGILVNFGHHPRIETMRMVADDKWSDRNTEPPDLKA